METKQKKSLLSRVPSYLLAILNLVIATGVLILTDSIWTPRTATGLKSHLINDLIISLGCFFIVQSNTKSLWYVPIISNAVLILSSFVEPKFWQSSMVFPICGGWVLSVIVSIIAAQLGKKEQTIL